MDGCFSQTGAADSQVQLDLLHQDAFTRCCSSVCGDGRVMTPLDASEVIRTIATETNTASKTVSKLYADTWAEFSEGARVQDFVPLFVAKRVRATLLDAQKQPH